ncbi:cytochrome P460 family protein [Halovulum marinum]|nr:cytochrome P460 family protein [Halovulum marinum]
MTRYIAAAAVLLATAALAGPDEVALPDGYQERFVNYLDVDRLDRNRVRKMYVSPEAHAAAQAGAPLPDGTVLIMEDHDAQIGADGAPMFGADGRLIALEPVVNIFVMETNAAWSTANETWDYAWYLPDGSPRPDASFDGCFSCHASRAERDYTFTYWTFLRDRAE